MSDIVKEIFTLDFTGNPQGVSALADEVERLQQVVEEAKKSGKGLEDATAKLAVKQREFVNATLGAGKAAKETKKSIDDQKKSIDDNTKSVGNGGNAFKNLRNEIRAYKAAALEAGETTPIGQEFIKKAAEASDRLADLNQSVLNLAKDTRVLNSVAEGARTFTAALQVGQGVMAQFVGENEDLQRVLVKLQGTQAILSGLTEIQNALQRESALATGIQTAKRFLLTGATAGMTVAELGATVATNALNFAVKALLGPIGLVLALIGAAVLVYKSFSTGSEAAAAAAHREAQEIKLLEIAYQSFKGTTERLLDSRKAELEARKKIAELLGASDQKLLKITLQSFDEEIAGLNRIRAQRYAELITKEGITKKKIELDEEYAETTDKISRALEARQIAILEHDKKRAEERKKILIDYNKLYEELRKQLAQSATNQIESDRQRELSETSQGFQERIDLIKNKSAEELELRKKLTASQIENLNAIELKLVQSLEEERQKKLKEIDAKFDAEETDREIAHLQLLGSLQQIPIQKKLDLLDQEKALALQKADIEIAAGRLSADTRLKIEEDYAEKEAKLRLGDIEQKKKVNDILAGLDATPFRDKLDLVEQERVLKREAAELEIKDAEELSATLLKIDQDAEAERRQLIKDRIDFIAGAFEEVANIGFDLFKQTNDADIETTDDQIARQERRVDEINKIASKGNAEELQLEQARLDELNKKKEKFVRQQQALAVVELIANSAIAVAKAAANPFPYNIIAIGATIAALAGGLIAARATASKAAFKDGVIDLPGPGTGTSDSINARLSRGESVMTAEETRLFKPTLLAIRAGDIMPDQLNNFATGNLIERALTIPMLTMGMGQDNSNLEDRLIAIERAMQTLPEEIGKHMPHTQFNIDERGFTSRISRTMSRTAEIDKRAR
jgi:hypothetical protein